jgi:hypothetical protein
MPGHDHLRLAAVRRVAKRAYPSPGKFNGANEYALFSRHSLQRSLSST